MKKELFNTLCKESGRFKYNAYLELNGGRCADDYYTGRLKEYSKSLGEKFVKNYLSICLNNRIDDVCNKLLDLCKHDNAKRIWIFFEFIDNEVEPRKRIEYDNFHELLRRGPKLLLSLYECINIRYEDESLQHVFYLDLLKKSLVKCTNEY